MKIATHQSTKLGILLLLLPFIAHAQQTRPLTKASSEGIKIGLALSGGGAKGFAHIGILKVFAEEGIPVHMVSGTSMGAIIGSLYAIGYSPKKIENIALSINWITLFNDSYHISPRNMSGSALKNTYLFTFPFSNNALRLPAGLVDGHNASMILYRLMLPYHHIRDFTKLPIPFAAVATDLSTGQAYTFTHGYLPDVVRASSAIPTLFRPVKINGKTYIDGGVARNIPAQDVRALGADLIIASDVGNPLNPVDSLNTFVEVLFQSIGFHQKESDVKQRKISDFYIRPEIEEFSSFSYDQIKTIIERGEQAAREIIPELKAYLKKHPPAPSTFESILPLQTDSLLISDVSFVNIEQSLKRQASLSLDIQAPCRLTLADIEKKINHLYSSGLFSQISYRLQNIPGTNGHSGNHLVLKFQPKEQEYVGLSARYDSEYEAALLFGASISNTLSQGDRISARLRVGEILQLSSSYSASVSLAPLSNFSFGLSFQRSPIDFYNRGQALSTVEVEQILIRPAVSVRLLGRMEISAGIEAEIFSLNEAVGNTLLLENTHFLMKNFVNLSYHSLNRPYFPDKGSRLSITAISNPGWGNSSTFFQLSANFTSALSLGEDISLHNNFFGAYSSTSATPLHYHFYLGGLVENPVFGVHQHPFMGYAAQQLRANNILMLSSELQFRLGQKTYLSAGMNIAHLSKQLSVNLFDKYDVKYGYGLSLGLMSIIGPVELSLSTPKFSGGYTAKVDIGYHF